MNPADPAAARVAAGRAFFAEVERLTAAGTSFVCESTLAGRGFGRVISQLKLAGFQIAIQYVYVSDPATCLARIAERVRRGGHDVPAEDVRRRYGRSARNFWHDYRLRADRWVLTYNGDDGFSRVIAGSRLTDIIWYDSERFDSFLDSLQTDA